VTDTGKSLGSWPNAPLALVVAQVRYQPSQPTDMPGLAQRFKDVAGQLFTEAQPVQQFSLVIGENGAPSSVPSIQVVGTDLRNDNGDRCLRLQEGAMTYHTSIYQGSEAFHDEWKLLLRVLCQDEPLNVVRLGLRYVDFIIPLEGEVPEDYFIEDFGRSPGIWGEQAPMQLNLYEYRRDNDGRLRIQYARGYGMPTLPPDLGDAAQPPGFLVRRYKSGVSGTMDMDRWRPAQGESMDEAKIGSEFTVMQADVREAFNRIISAKAKAVWQGQPKEAN
jgi:uncharacterized protein (TIGR04255 family)